MALQSQKKNCVVKKHNFLMDDCSLFCSYFDEGRAINFEGQVHSLRGAVNLPARLQQSASELEQLW